MEPLKGIPLTGQGDPLPRDFPYKGQWLHKYRLFLYRLDEAGDTEMTAVARWGSDICAGINSKQLASVLGLSSEEIFEHNKANTLFLVRADDMPAARGSTRAKRYIFQIGERQGGITIEGGGPSGN